MTAPDPAFAEGDRPATLRDLLERRRDYLLGSVDPATPPAPAERPTDPAGSTTR
jgi:hypothetical protein